MPCCSSIARWQGKPLTAAGAVHALGGSISNSAFIGYPLVTLALGPVAVVAMALNMIVENILMMPLTLALAEAASRVAAGARSAHGAALRLAQAR